VWNLSYRRTPNPLTGYDSCNQVAFVNFVLETYVFFGFFPVEAYNFYVGLVRFRNLLWISQLCREPRAARMQASSPQPVAPQPQEVQPRSPRSR